MPKYITPIIDRRDIARETVELKLKKPRGFDFKAGQYINLTFISPPETDANGDCRYLSIASAPNEDYLIVAARIKNSAFKNNYKSLPLGTGVGIDEPAGSLTLSEDERPAVFLAGGIGITPFRSMILSSLGSNPREMYLFYSNRQPNDAAYLEEFHGLSEKHSNFKFIPTMTRVESTVWQGETGRINRNMLKKYLLDPTKPVYYVVGSHPFLTSIKEHLLAMGVQNQQIQREAFCGYCPEHTCCCSHI